MTNGIQGIQGLTGNGIASITKTATSGLVDTYTITYTNGNTTTFTVTNGEDGEVTETELNELRQQVEDLEDNQRTNTATGTEIYISDSAKAKVRSIGLTGRSTQEERRGYNIFPSAVAQTVQNKGLTIECDGKGRYNVSGTPTDNVAFDFELPEQVTLPISAGQGGKGKMYLFNDFTGGTINFMTPDKGTIDSWELSRLNRTHSAYSTMGGKVCKYIRIYGSPNVAMNGTLSPMFTNEGDTNREFQEYNGQAVIPISPDNVTPIKSCGDNVNLFDKTQTIAQIYVTETAQRYGYKIPVKAGTYTVSGGGADVYTKTLIGTTYGESNSLASYVTLTLSSDGFILIYGLTSSVVEPFINTMKLEQGTQATPYSPYGCGNVNEKVQSKNVFKIENFIEAMTKVGLRVTEIEYKGKTCYEIRAGSNYSGLCELNFKDNTQYAIQLMMATSKENYYFRWKYSDGTLGTLESVTNLPDFTKVTSISSINKTIIGFQFELYNGTILYFQKDTIQLEQGSTPSDYVPHEEQTLSFPLAQGQKLMEGDYLADDGVKHKRKQVVFNGTEDWYAFGSNVALRNWDNRLTPEHTNQTLQGYLCNIAIEGKASDTLNNNVFGTYNQPASDWIVFNINISVADWKAYLAQQYANGTPVIVEYELAEETTEDFTEEQKEAWEQIKKARTYKGGTHISSEDETPANVDIEYVVDVNTIYDRVTALENIINS